MHFDVERLDLDMDKKVFEDGIVVKKFPPSFCVLQVVTHIHMRDGETLVPGHQLWYVNC